MPEQCNAQIDVGGKTLTCNFGHSDHSFDHMTGDGSVQWNDLAPGAVPHTPPCSDCEQSHREWQQAIVAQQEACRERDRARADADLLREELKAVKLKEAGMSGELVGLRYRAKVAEEKRDKYEAEAAHYREALEDVVRLGSWSAVTVAREALEGVSRD